MTSATTTAPGRRHRAVTPDQGCAFAPRCMSCPWATCIRELPNAERIPCTAAPRLVRGYLAAPDGTLDEDRQNRHHGRRGIGYGSGSTGSG